MVLLGNFDDLPARDMRSLEHIN